MTYNSNLGTRPPEEAARLFQTVVTHSTDGMVVIDADGIVRLVNPAAEHLLDRSAADLLGTTLGQPIAIGESAEMTVTRRDGSPVTIELRASRITWEGSPAVLASLRDISDRIKAQIRIEHLNSALRAIREVNKLIVRETDPTRLIQQTCELLIRTHGYTGVQIAIGDGSVPPSSFAQAGWGEAPDSFAGSLRGGHWPHFREEGVAADDVITVNGPYGTSGEFPLSGLHGEGTALVTALRHDGKMLGQLSVSIRAGLTPDEEMKSLLAEVATDVAFALHTIEAGRLQRESEARFRIITESSPDAIFLANRTGDYTYANAAASELLGYSIDELLRLNIVDIAAKDGVHDTRRAFQDLLAQGRMFVELDLVRKDGAIVPVDLNAILLPTGEVYGSCRDLTHRRRSEDALRKSQRLLEDILDSIPASVFWKDTNLVYLGCNTAFARDAGFAGPAEVIGKDDYQMGWRAQAEQYRGNDREVIASGVPKLLCEEPQTTPAGDTVTLLTSKLPLRGVNGEITGVLGTYLDITELKRLQAQLGQADRLSNMGMLAAGVAHEINNPLCYILYNLESLTEDLPPLLEAVRRSRARPGHPSDPRDPTGVTGEGGQEPDPAGPDDVLFRLREALEGTRRIREIARGLGTFSRVEKNQLVRIDLMQVIEVAVNMAFNEIKYRARLVKDYARTPAVLVNEGRLSQVFLNLIINAAHAVTEGDVDSNEIRVRTWAEGDEVCAEVRDTGSGIAPEQIGKLFDPFFTTKKVGDGTGLGLAISKNIVEDHGGTIQVSSEVGVGTSFVVRLPVREEEAAAPRAPSPATAAPGVRGRILIVDDEAGIRTSMARMLRAHETVQAATGAEAMAILENDQAFDLILCDMMMPHISGMDLHEWLRGRQPRLAGQLIFITGGVFTPRARDYLSGIDNLRLEKPFDVAEFKMLVAERVNMAKGPRPE